MYSINLNRLDRKLLQDGIADSLNNTPVSPVGGYSPAAMDWLPHAPDRLVYDTWLAAASQQASVYPPDAFNLLTPIAICTVFPSRVGAYQTHAVDHPPREFAPQYGGYTPTLSGVGTVYPSTIGYIQVHASDQPTSFAIGQPPGFVGAFGTVFPSRIGYVQTHPVDQLAVTELPPLPATTVPFVAPYFPDVVSLRPPSLAVHEQLAFVLPPKPERTAPIADAEPHPDFILRPFLRPSQHLAVTQVPPKPELTVPLAWAPYYPDRALHLSLLVPEHPFFFFAPKPEDRVPFGWWPSYPDWLPRSTTLHSSQRGGLQIALIPAPFVYYPDRLDAHLFRASRVHLQLAVTELYPLPITTTTFFTPVFPDWLERRSAQQGIFAALAPKPEDHVDLDWWPVFPDRALHAWLLPADQQAFALAPFPERTSALVSVVFPDWLERRSAQQGIFAALAPKPEDHVDLDWWPVFPDRALHAWLLPADQQAFALAPFPERTSALVSVVFPDWLERRSAQQGIFAALAPKPEDHVDLDWWPVFPDRALHAWLLPADQQAFALAPFPERTSALVSVVFPDWLERRSAQQGIFAALAPKPEDHVDLDWWPVFPDRALHAWLLPADQQAFALAPFPERTSALVSVVFPDWLERRSAQQGIFAALAPKPERTAPLAVVVFPDWLERRSAQQGIFAALAPKPEDHVDLDWWPVFPDRALHAWLLPADQQAFALAPFPERTSALVSVVFPDWLERRSAQQGIFAALAPKPEDHVDLDWWPVFPDRALHAWLLPADQQAFALAPFPERTSALVSVVFPDWLERRSAQQGIFAALAPKPEDHVDLDWWPVFPDRALHAWLLPADQQAFASSPLPITFQIGEQQYAFFPDWLERRSAQQGIFAALAPKPERTAPLAVVVFPDWLERRSAQQGIFATLAPKPEDHVDLDWWPVFPDRALHAWLLPADQQAFALAPFPERTSALVSVVFPDWLERRSAQQGIFAALAPKPEDHVDLDWWPVFPDRALHAWLLPADQQAFALAPFPERTSALVSVVFPDWLERRSAQQGIFAALAPKPEDHVDLDWWPVFPDRALHAWLLPADQQAFASSPLPITFQIGEQQYAFFPDWLERRSAQQGIFAALAPKPERTAPLAVVVFPDWLERRSAQQGIFATLAPKPERTAPIAVVVFPDWLERRSAQQGIFAALAPKPEDHVDLDWWPVFPDRALHAWLLPADQQAFASSPLPITFQIGEQQYAFFPDWLERRSAQQGIFAALAPKPEDHVDLDWWPVFPDRALHAWLLPADQQAFASSPLPITFQIGEQQYAFFPDWLERRSAQQGIFATLAPKPERTAPLAVVVFPDWLERRSAQQGIFATLAPKPERTAPLAVVVFPDWLERRSAQQGIFAALAPKPEQTVALDWFAIFPDHVSRQFYLAAEQWVTSGTKPEETVPLDWMPEYPDFAPRGSFLTANQPYFASNITPIPNAVPTQPLLSYPDWLPQPGIRAALQPFVTELSPKPVPPPPPGPSALGPPPTGGWEDPVRPEVRAQTFLDEQITKRIVEHLLSEYAASQQQQLVSLRPTEEPQQDAWHAEPVPPHDEWHAEPIPSSAPNQQVVNIGVFGNVGEVHVHHHHYGDRTDTTVETASKTPASLPAAPAPAIVQDDSLSLAALGAAIGGVIGGLPGVAIGAILGFLLGKKSPPQLPPAPPPPQLPPPTEPK